ncbi:oligopeptide ABC transporter [Halalkalibacter wakoensis JCM 9140]|uniref:Oligopeptide ABC transporter n=1 Tax=Halalkalibacter wakoensis JCM 9140 TaxID=1236970 RepID=W4QA53_9BACI|nr:ABC transporter substrate-binding protein [Halalkalibacter wakoensis]GAE28553.1 oligopeptide ABC transporter [Halalkalibacter wakoensis JCM 9140]
MDVLEYYIELKRLPEYEQAEEIYISKQEIADVLFCSSRNVHYILQRWIEEGYVHWKSQRGRGKKSTLTFLKSMDAAVLLHVETLVQKGKVKEAMSFAMENNFSSGLQETLLSTIQKAFGIQQIEDEEELNDVLHIPLQHSLYNLNPFFVTVATEAHILNEIFDTLVRYNVDSKTIEPHLANGWESNEDYTIWSFYIRKGIHFHDGSLLTAKDIQGTFQALINEETNIPNKWLLEGIEDITIQNKYTISFHLKDGNHVFPHFLSAIYTSIIPAESNIKDSCPIGTGPYRVEYQEKDKIILNAFDDHFQGRPFIDQVHLWKLPESHLNTLHFFTEHPLEKNKATTSTYTVHDNGSNYIIFNMKKDGVHQSRYFRQAVKAMVNPHDMIEQLGQPRIAASTSFIPERSDGKKINHSIERAKQLLKNSNYEGETIHLAALRFEDFLEDAYWMKQKLSEIGIKVVVHPIELSDLYNEQLMLSFDAIYTGEGFEDNIKLSILILLRNEYGIRRFLNESQRKELNKGFETIKKQSDDESFIQAFLAVEEQLTEDATIIFTVHSSEQNTYQTTVQGIQLSGYGWPIFHKLWLKN